MTGSRWLPPAGHGYRARSAPVRSGVPNKPKTKTRGFRIPDDEYEAAQETAERRGETLTDEVRRALRAYVKRNKA